jgi:hypothetical protein
VPRSRELEKKISEKYKLDQPLNADKKVNSRKKFMLPWWFKIVAYGLSFTVCGVSLFFIIAKGIQFGDEKVGKWLTSFVSSILSSFLITQPIQVSLLTALFVCIFRKSNSDKNIFDSDQTLSPNAFSDNTSDQVKNTLIMNNYLVFAK